MQAGQAWARLGEFEAAGAALAKGAAQAQALLPQCFEQRGRGPQHSDCAALVLELLQERVRVSLHFDQQVGAGPSGAALAAGCCQLRSLRDSTHSA